MTNRDKLLANIFKGRKLTVRYLDENTRLIYDKYIIERIKGSYKVFTRETWKNTKSWRQQGLFDNDDSSD